jgi:hypothetical protein
LAPEFDQYLREKYPLIFSGHCELSVDDGWFDLIDILCAKITGHIQHIEDRRKHNIKWNEEVNDPNYDWTDRSFVKREERNVPELVEQVVAIQIKEKFGTLRFYYDGGDEYITGLVAMAGAMSSVLCEECGKPGKTGKHGRTGSSYWIKTYCPEHGAPPIEDEDEGETG